MENTLLKSNNQFNSLEFNNELESDNINKINTNNNILIKIKIKNQIKN